MVELYLNSPIRLPGLVPDYDSTLPLRTLNHLVKCFAGCTYTESWLFATAVRMDTMDRAVFRIMLENSATSAAELRPTV
jgi:hypothetical protein